MEPTSSTNPGSAQPGSGHTTTPTVESAPSMAQLFNLQLEPLSNLTDQNAAVMQGWLQSVNKSLKAMDELQQKGSKSIQSMAQPAIVRDRFQQQHEENFVMMRVLLQSMKQSLEEIHESQQKEANSVVGTACEWDGSVPAAAGSEHGSDARVASDDEGVLEVDA